MKLGQQTREPTGVDGPYGQDVLARLRRHVVSLGHGPVRPGAFEDTVEIEVVAVVGRHDCRRVLRRAETDAQEDQVMQVVVRPPYPSAGRVERHIRDVRAPRPDPICAVVGRVRPSAVVEVRVSPVSRRGLADLPGRVAARALPINSEVGQQPREPTGVDGPYGQDILARLH